MRELRAPRPLADGETAADFLGYIDVALNEVVREYDDVNVGLDAFYSSVGTRFYLPRGT